MPPPPPPKQRRSRPVKTGASGGAGDGAPVAMRGRFIGKPPKWAVEQLGRVIRAAGTPIPDCGGRPSASVAPAAAGKKPQQSKGVGAAKEFAPEDVDTQGWHAALEELTRLFGLVAAGKRPAPAVSIRVGCLDYMLGEFIDVKRRCCVRS